MPHVTLNGVELYCKEAGDGFPVVLVHGSVAAGG
jgi:hypothetical protein